MTAPRTTFPCFAAAYGRKGRPRAGALSLTHACEVDADGFPTRALCNRVTLESICADLTQATSELPTCPVCVRKVARRASSG